MTWAKVRFLNDADSRDLSGSTRCLSAFSASSTSCLNDGATLGDCEVLLVGNGVGVVLGAGCTGSVHIIPCSRSDTP